MSEESCVFKLSASPILKSHILLLIAGHDKWNWLLFVHCLSDWEIFLGSVLSEGKHPWEKLRNFVDKCPFRIAYRSILAIDEIFIFKNWFVILNFSKLFIYNVNKKKIEAWRENFDAPYKFDLWQATQATRYAVNEVSLIILKKELKGEV